MWQNIDALIRIVARSPDPIEGPKIAATDKVNLYLKRKIMHHVESIKENFLKSSDFGSIIETAQNKEDLKEILNSLGEIVDKYLTMPEIISALLKAIKSRPRHSVLEQSVNAAFIAMFTFKNRKGASPYLEDNRAYLIEIGSAALFRDIGRIVHADQYPGMETTAHPVKSAELAEALGLNPDVIYAILYHHAILAADQLQSPPSDLARLYKDIIVVIDLFISLTSEKKYKENEVVLGLYNLARNGYLDQPTVRALGDMYIGKDKSRLIADGIRLIGEACRNPGKEAYVWNPSAPVPYSIICAHQTCPEIGTFTVEAHKTIESELSMGMVPAGKYRHCKKLTKSLLEGAATILGAKLISELCDRLDIRMDS